MKIVVHVTAEDIAAGEVGDCRRCPIAVALTRAVPLASFVKVYCATAKIYAPRDAIDRTNVTVSLPYAAEHFIFALDACRPGRPRPGPFDFELDVPDRFVA